MERSKVYLYLDSNHILSVDVHDLSHDIKLFAFEARINSNLKRYSFFLVGGLENLKFLKVNPTHKYRSLSIWQAGMDLPYHTLV